MPEHWIRLRGGWDWQSGSAADATKRPLTLPIEWPAGQASPVRLLRRFGCPPIDPLHESLSLRLENVPGLLAIQFNGRSVNVPLEESLSFSLESIGPILAKNLLILEVDPARATRPGETWGQIALIVEASRGDDESPAATP
ncbi:hypothetical protein V5E97_30775 [Singulisphaera sp. Ch08]|uniref:Uncharacterized protein n=1 Tax=Singulisphaera sp. Ch08 TaxID=3120278 RepID=A0AAU7CC38_9BACT